MRMRLFGVVVSLVVLGGPLVVQAQEVIPRPFVGPLSHPRYEDDGFYTGLEFIFWKQRNPLKNQPIATRGLVDITGQINGVPGGFLGSNEIALDTEQLRGPTTYSPGFNLTLGYRFQDGIALQASWWHLTDVRYNASAGPIGPNFNVGDQLENTFLSAPVVNLPPAFNGFPINAVGTPPGSTVGIYNAATIMQIEFKQRFDMVEFMGRIPIMETDNWRSYGLFGPRAIVMWERFKWFTQDFGLLGQTTDSATATYTNVVSNRLYGLSLGGGNEFRLGDSPIGTFSVFTEANADLYADFIKTRAQYSLGDGTSAVRRKRNMWTLAPGFHARAGFNWYIYEAITIRLGYTFTAILNTAASPRPVDFNAGTVDPGYKRDITRWFDGLDFGVGLVW